ncbi:translesion DNA synthesis-associated protein ImuA [Zoogloea sp.]|uniref:translesion DNA synthesis-associated protein ImuA n=1 Tax=Zoogloea sp. TaxID=49181 RepID=UPI001A5FDBA6|nr:translesion DNA synthesis-associated protein ImuA [Zoogloea sp.]
MATPAALSATALAALDHLVWRGDRLAVEAAPGRPTGHPALDAVLPGGGWPAGALTELLIPHFGVGELGLLLPQLRNIPVGRWGLCIAPPGLPYAPALAAAGVPLGRLLLVQAESPAHARWACRQALASRSCEIVLLWLAEADMAALRRLQLAAEDSATPLIVLRPAGVARQASPAVLRLELNAAPGGVRIRVLKRRGPMLAAPVDLVLPWSAAYPRPDLAVAAEGEHASPSSRPHSAPQVSVHALVRPRPARSGLAGVHTRTQ